MRSPTMAEERTLRARALTFGASALSACLIVAAVPRWDLWPLALVALVPLYLAVRRLRPAEACAFGWVTGFAVNLYGYTWTVAAMHRFGKVEAAPALCVLVVVCAYQAVTFAIVAGGATLLERRARLPWLVGAPLLVVLAESTLPFLFPWYLGLTVSRAWPLMQVAELGGPSAVSAWIVLVNVAVGDALGAYARHKHPSRRTAVGAAVAGAIFVLGLARAAHVAWLSEHARQLRVGIVQPNFGVVSREQRSRQGQRLAEVLRAQTDELGAQGAELVVWPESSFPFVLERGLDHEYAAGHPWALRSTYHGSLLIGALTHDFESKDVYNSAILLAPDGQIAGRYDKVRLMPFGEYIPLADRYPNWAARVKQRLPDSPLITPGTQNMMLESAEIRIAPMVCYEDILPETAADIAARSPNANLLVTLVNHAWFGDSLAPSESLALATFRSIELRRALIRAANTGVSSIGDALGRIVVEGPLVATSEEGEVPPLRLLAEVPLVETWVLGPLFIAGFPYVCAIALIAASIWSRSRAP